MEELTIVKKENASSFLHSFISSFPQRNTMRVWLFSYCKSDLVMKSSKHLNTQLKKSFRERVREKLERKHNDSRNFDSHMSAIHSQIKMSFGYVVLLIVFHILTRWIFYISLSLRDIASRKIIEEIPFSRKSQSSTILSFIHRWIGLAFRYVVHQDVF